MMIHRLHPKSHLKHCCIGFVKKYQNDYMWGLKVLKKDICCCQVSLCFIFRVCELDQFRRKWWMSRYIVVDFDIIMLCWKFPKLWGYFFIFWYMSEFIFSVWYILFKGLHIDSFGICEKFWYVKTENGFFWKNTKNYKYKTSKHLKTQL